MLALWICAGRYLHRSTTNTRAHTHTHTQTHTYPHKHTHETTHARTYTHTHTHTHTRNTYTDTGNNTYTLSHPNFTVLCWGAGKGLQTRRHVRWGVNVPFAWHLYIVCAFVFILFDAFMCVCVLWKLTNLYICL